MIFWGKKKFELSLFILHGKKKIIKLNIKRFYLMWQLKINILNITDV